MFQFTRLRFFSLHSSQFCCCCCCYCCLEWLIYFTICLYLFNFVLYKIKEKSKLLTNTDDNSRNNNYNNNAIATSSREKMTHKMEWKRFKLHAYNLILNEMNHSEILVYYMDMIFIHGLDLRQSNQYFIKHFTKRV